MKIISRFFFHITGWRIIGDNAFPLKCVAIAAPHTSNWDFVFGRCYAYIVGIRPKYLAKSELFSWFLSPFLKMNGAIPVNRSDRNNLVKCLSKLFDEKEDLILNLAPEGTRKRVSKWKTGFYHIALKANVPIIIMAIDYKKKEIGVIGKIIPSGDYLKDISVIEHMYNDVQAKYPHDFNRSFS